MKDIIESDSAHKAADERLLPRARRRRTLKQQDFLFDRLRVRDLSELARLRHPDGHGDYVLPDTPAGRHLALAIITHWLRRPGERGKWLFQFCHDRAPWLDPNEIDVTQLRPSKAQKLGGKLQLTIAERTQLHITTIAPCDQTPEQGATLRKERRRQRERDRRRRKQEAKNGMTRAQWEATSKSRTRPWEAEGASAGLPGTGALAQVPWPAPRQVPWPAKNTYWWTRNLSHEATARPRRGWASRIGIGSRWSRTAANADLRPREYLTVYCGSTCLGLLRAGFSILTLRFRKKSFSSRVTT